MECLYPWNWLVLHFLAWKRARVGIVKRTARAWVFYLDLARLFTLAGWPAGSVGVCVLQVLRYTLQLPLAILLAGILSLFPRERRVVQVDHIIPIAAELGTQEMWNYQVLCTSHHARKTKRDMRRLAGQRVYVFSLRRFLAGFRHGQARVRLHEACAAVTNVATTDIHRTKVKKWGRVRVPGIYRKQWRPMHAIHKYSHVAFSDAIEREGRGQFEDMIRAKFPGQTWMFRWWTGHDRVEFFSPDPLATSKVFSWPLREVTRTSIWQPFPVGITDTGDTEKLSLIENHVLLSGEVGAGKSVAMNLMLAYCMLDPSVTLYLVDGKRVEFAQWKACAEDVVGPDPVKFLQLLQDLQRAMDVRYMMLESRRALKIDYSMTDMAPIVLAIDELALFVNQSDRKLRTDIHDSLRDIISRGRAAGIIVLAATQRPSANIISTDFRDLFPVRWVMRQTTRESSDMGLGSGMSSKGFNAASIARNQRGVGLLLHEGALPTRLKTFFLGNEIAAVAERAARLRSSADTERHAAAGAGAGSAGM